MEKGFKGEFALLKGGMLESQKPGHQLSMVCQDFVATNMAQKNPDQETKSLYLKKIGEILGVKLIAVDKESNNVVHGTSLLEKMKKQ